MKSTSPQPGSLVEFLTEFAKFMIQSGVSLNEFQSAATTAFLRAAMGKARLRNSRVNQSALAALTGLNRTQVRAVLKEWEEGAVDQPNRLSVALDAWQTDPQFVSSMRGRSLIPIRGRNGSFSALVRKYCGDVSYKALLSELRALGYVKVHDHSVELTAKGKAHLEPQEFQQLSSGLAFAIRNDLPLEASVSVFTAEAVYRTPSQKSRLLIKKRVLQSTKAFAAEIKAAGEAEASKTQTRSEKRTRSSVLVVTVDQGDKA